MRQRRSFGWVLILSLLAMLFTAGGVSAAPTATPLAQGEAPAFRLELPRIVVTVDKDGFPSAFGLHGSCASQRVADHGTGWGTAHRDGH